MVKHIVMWKFKPGTQEQARQFIDGLRGLYGVIPQIKEQEVGLDCGVAGNYSGVLVSAFDSMEDLEAYKKDPRHVAVSSLCKAIREDRVCVDYII